MKFDASRLEAVCLEEILHARELRAEKQKELCERWRTPVICLTLNIPGPFKTFPLAQKTFWEGMSLVEKALTVGDVPVRRKETIASKTGWEGFFAADGDGVKIKKLMMDIEDNHALGRLLDVDVISEENLLIKSKKLGRPERQCFICGGPVWICARQRAHTVSELIDSVYMIMSAYFDKKYDEQAAGRGASCYSQGRMREL